MARDTKKNAAKPKRRIWLAAILALTFFGCTAYAALEVRRYAISSPSFVLSRDQPEALTIVGLRYASHSKVTHVFSEDFGHSIFSIPLAARRRRLLGIDWVEDASVSRVWPGRLIVRLKERHPVAFVSFPTGVLLIDAYGVLLDPPPQSQFSFPVLSGVREDQEEYRRAECVRILLRIQRELGAHAGEISEVNAADPDNVLVVARVDNRAVELLMGDSGFGDRYVKFLNAYPEIHRKSPDGKVFDLRLEDRITVKE
ncbi:MAG TPA: FtsQ-type POTRA domain-containing protein [Verrucomicrobiae bacterium]|nr:FtsQ-type POTRA domain-containing protein [Verrucomicrobiae bacterium]